MALILLPVAVASLYIGSWRASARRRKAQSWESLLSRLRPDLNTRALSDYSLWKEGLSATPEDVWQRIEGARGLCAMYQNAGVMLEMADYAARNGSAVDRELLRALARDAMHIRLYVLIAFGQYAVTQVNDNICLHAYQAASIYVEMAARMTQLLQLRAGIIVPDFVAAL
jgi:hypothetical protein